MPARPVLASTAAFALSVILFGATADAQTMRFDFGNTGQQTLLPGWNNVIYPNPDPAPPLLAVVDSNDDLVPGVTLVVTEQFFITGVPSQLGTEAPAGDAALFPVAATDDYFFGHTGPFAGSADASNAAVKLTGLDPNLIYDFTLFSSRTGVNDNRDTAFTVTGLNSDSGVINTANNDTQVLKLLGIAPDGSNEIRIDIAAAPSNTNGNSFYYFNAMQVTAVPEPATLSLVALLSLGLARRR